jgi:DivIVA domain-containing protein
VNEDAVERIRSASFPSALKGYDRGAVDRFLDELSERLAGDPELEADSRSDVVRRELERIGESTTAILTDAHDAAEAMRRDAEQRVRQQLAEVNLRVEALQGEADEYAERVREEADAYARRTRAAADGFAAEEREKAERAAEQLLEDAERRRRDIEAIISDLEARRDTVIEQLRRLVDSAAGGGEPTTSAAPAPRAPGESREPEAVNESREPGTVPGRFR